jgi:hypothetical protein
MTHRYDGERNTVFLLSGGAGRIVTAIPALEKYARLNPQDDFKVLIYGWASLYWNHPILQERTFDADQKGIFDLVIKNSNLYQPEPYHRWTYYNQQKSLIEAFDEEINSTNDHSDLTKPNLYLHSNEKNSAKAYLDNLRKEFKRNKVVVLQPFGATANVNEEGVFSDDTQRSLSPDTYLKIVKKLPKTWGVLFMGPSQLIHQDDKNTLVPQNLDMRSWMGIINEADYFLGIDSLGQHIARAFDKDGLVIMGSTFEDNVSYPDHFKFYRNKNAHAKYSPIRIGGLDGQMADRLNDEVMNFSENQIDDIVRIVKKNIR